MAISTPLCNFGWKAPDFELNDTLGVRQTLDTLRAPRGLLLMFICNHCPYVKAIIDRICRDALEVQGMGFGVAAIMSNDTDAYPDDSLANMQRVARAMNFSFPYLYDPTQQPMRGVNLSTPCGKSQRADTGPLNRWPAWAARSSGALENGLPRLAGHHFHTSFEISQCIGLAALEQFDFVKFKRR
jgi:peroxiredoxin